MTELAYCPVTWKTSTHRMLPDGCLTSDCFSSSVDQSRIELSFEVIRVPRPNEKIGTEDEVGCFELVGIIRLLRRIASRTEYYTNAFVCYGPENDM